MSIPGSLSTNTNLSKTIMNNNLHQQQFLFDHLRNHRSNKVSSASNFSFDPDLLRELNARFLHDMNATHTINGNGFSTFLRAKHYHQHTHTHEHNLNILTPLNKSENHFSSSSTKKSNKWCTAHVRISWMIYHQQQQQRLKDRLSLSDKKINDEQQLSLNNKLPDLISNTKPILPFLSNDPSLLPLPTYNYRSPFDVSNNSFGGLGSVFPLARKADINGSIPSLNLNSSQSSHSTGSYSLINDNFSSKKVDEAHRKHFSSAPDNNDDRRNSSHYLTNQNSSLLLSRKSSSDNCKTSSHSLPSTYPTFDPLTLSIIERQRLSAAYASLFASTSQGKNFSPMNIDSSAMAAALVQREHFFNSLHLLQQQQHEQMIERERGTILDNNSVQINRPLKTKFEQISPIYKEERKRIKLENATSPASNSSTSSSIKSKHVKREKQSSSPLSIASTNQSHDLISKEHSIPSISIIT